MTRWLDRLTPYDLSKVDCSGCTSIHGWLDMIAAVTELDPITSSGTTGTMSFTPKDRTDWRTFILGGFRVQLLQKFGQPPGDDDLNQKLHVCWPTHADGHTAFYRSPMYYKEYFAKGSDAHFHPMMNTPGSRDAHLALSLLGQHHEYVDNERGTCDDRERAHQHHELGHHVGLDDDEMPY